MAMKKILVLGLLVLIATAIGSAAPLSFTGTFTLDEDIVQMSFLVPTSSLVTIQTTSFADGKKGFEPVLSLFDPAGNLLLVDQGGTTPSGCGVRGIDSVSGFCLDAYIQTTLAAGTYTLTLTEWDNLPNGPTLADGFPQTGNGNFTGPNFTGLPGSFILFDGSQRTNQWALLVDGAAVPEPGTFSLAAVSLLAVLTGRKVIRRNRVS